MEQNTCTRKIIVVIVNWERSEDTIQCIQSLISDNIEQTHILIVDNGSRDNSIEQIQTVYPLINILSLPNNLGFAGGYNAGIEYALATDADYILLLNNDTVVEKGSISALLSSTWDVAVPKILYHGSKNRIWAAGARLRSFPPAVVMIGFNHLDGIDYNVPYLLRYATGCALMIRRSVLESVGGFDIAYKNYMEDYDFSYRVYSMGFSMGYVPKARIYHKVSKTLGAKSSSRWWYQGRNTVLFYRKDDRFSVWMLWLVLVWVCIREIIKREIKSLRFFCQGVQDGFTFLRK